MAYQPNFAARVLLHYLPAEPTFYPHPLKTLIKKCPLVRNAITMTYEGKTNPMGWTVKYYETKDILKSMSQPLD